MKKIFHYSLIVLFIVGLYAIPHFANALTLDPTIALADWLMKNMFSIIGEIVNAALYIGMTLSAFVLWAAGFLLDFSMKVLVLDMKSTIESIDAIFTVWQTLRDLANMCLIFIILYIAIQTILGGADYQKMLTKVIIVALFINFSLFFVNIMVDASNILSSVFYGAIVGSTPCAEGNAGCLTLRVLSSLDLNSLYTRDVASWSELTSQVTLGIVSKLLGILVIGMVAIAFLASTAIIVKRFIVLILAMMFSPLAFASQVLPQTSKLWNFWWGKVTGECVSMPIYFLYLWVVFKIMESDTLKAFGPTVTNKSLATAIAGSDGNTLAVLFINYIIIIALLWLAPIVAAMTGSSGAGWAKTISNGLSGFIAQQTVGRAASRLANSNALRSVSRIPVVGHLAADFGRKQLSNVAKYDFGGSKGGFVGSEAAAVKAAEDYRKWLDGGAKKEKEEKEKGQKKEKEELDKKHKQELDTHKELEDAQVKATEEGFNGLTEEEKEKNTAARKAAEDLAEEGRKNLETEFSDPEKLKEKRAQILAENTLLKAQEKLLNDQVDLSEKIKQQNIDRIAAEEKEIAELENFIVEAGLEGSTNPSDIRMLAEDRQKIADRKATINKISQENTDIDKKNNQEKIALESKISAQIDKAKNDRLKEINAAEKQNIREAEEAMKAEIARIENDKINQIRKIRAQGVEDRDRIKGNHTEEQGKLQEKQAQQLSGVNARLQRVSNYDEKIKNGWFNRAFYSEEQRNAMIAGSSKKSEKEKFAEQFEKAVKEEADKNKDKK